MQALKHEKIKHQQDQGHVMMPANPGSSLEMIEAQFVLELLIVLFDPPSDLSIPDQIDKLGAVGEI